MDFFKVNHEIITTLKYVIVTSLVGSFLFEAYFNWKLFVDSVKKTLNFNNLIKKQIPFLMEQQATFIFIMLL